MRRRDLGNEVIVALAAIGMLALALTFGIVLTLSRTPTTGVPGAVLSGTTTAQALAVLATTAFAQPQSTAAATAPATAPATEQATEPAAATTAIATSEVAVADTQVSTEAATTSPTSGSTQSTSTLTATPTFSKTPTLTKTTTMTMTSTPAGSPTASAMATNTPTETFTTTVTLVALVPVSTATHPVPTDPSDSGILPTNTPLASASPLPDSNGVTASATSTSCTLRSGWVIYTVQQGDTLFSISRQAGDTLADLQQANCITNPASIYWGQLILIPPNRIILTGTPYAGSVALDTGAGNANICPDPTIRITSPVEGSGVSGVVTISGSANIPNFRYFVVDYRPEINADFASFGNNLIPVTNGVLARFDPNPAGLPMGRYVIRLRVVNADGNGPVPCTIHFTLTR